MKTKILFTLILAAVLLGSASADVFSEYPDSCLIGGEVCNVGEAVEVSITGTGLFEAHGANVTCIAYFYGIGCSKCAETGPFIEQLEEKYCNRVRIHYIEVYHNESNYGLYDRYANSKGIPLNKRAIPLVAIGDRYFMGASQIKENLEEEILRENPLESVCPLTGEPGCSLDYNPIDVSPSKKTEISIPAIVVAGLVDSINPCAFAVMIFLLTFLLEVSSSTKRVLKAGLAYIMAVYVTYFLSGLGFLSVVQYMGVTRVVVQVAAVVAIAAGLINVKDYFWYGKGFTLKIPESQKGRIGRWVHKANVPGAVVLGFLVSMFELPCTGGVYLAILALMADTLTRMKALIYLLLYNLVFIAPLGVILVLILKGMKAEQMENWRQSKKNVMKLAMGLLLIALGMAMLLGWSI